MSYEMGKILWSAAVVALLASACWKPSLTSDYTVTVVSDVVYGTGEINGGSSTADLKLDLYLPDVPGQDLFPLLVVIHGGSFRHGSKSAARESAWAMAYASRGYLVASIDYRLESQAPVPSARVAPLVAATATPIDPQTMAGLSAIDDTLTALDFLQQRPDVEPFQTVLVGSSAGAIAALYVGHGLDDYGIDRPLVSAVISNFGAYGWADLPGDETHIDGSAADVISLNPLYLYSEPPLFLAHGELDTLVPYADALAIANEATAVGLNHEMFTAVGEAHGFDLFATEYSPGVSVIQAQVNWLDSILIGVRATPPASGDSLPATG